MGGTNIIQIQGEYDKKPWILKRIDGGEISKERKVYRFGTLCEGIIDLIKGRGVIYKINYKGGSVGNIHIFEEPEERVIYHLISTHNNLVKIIKGDLD